MNRQSIRLNAHYAFVLCIALGLTSLGCHNSSAASSSAGAESSASAASRGSSHSGATRVTWTGTKRVSMIDPQAGMAASTMDIPAGWKFAGELVSLPGCHGVATSPYFTAQAQDGVTAIIVLPAVKWNVAPPVAARGRFTMPMKCRIVDITTASDFLVKMAIPNMHSDAKVEAVLPLLPEGQAAIAKQLEQMQQQAAMAPPPMRASDQTLDGARVRIQYIRNGQPVEEMVTVIIACSTSQVMGRVCTSRPISIYRAPRGQLDAMMAHPQLDAIPKSTQINPQWAQFKQQQDQQLYNKYEGLAAQNHQMFEQNLRNSQQQFNQQIANDRAQDAQRAQGTANAMAADRARQAAIDQSAHNTVNYSLDRRDYTNPNTGQTVTASSEYNHQWVNSSNDTLVQTNDPNFDPNGSVSPVSEGWTELVPK